ncbi:hypothetical protein [Thauera sp.]|uniref:hypothetical protein n=1 Tax=Thauera sp. TaxID=1905334 RepID=UPI0039E27FD4
MKVPGVFPALRAMLTAVSLLAASAAGAADEPPARHATYVGEQVCVSCHQVEESHFGHTLHAKIFRQNPRNDVERQVCEACHGPGSLHAENMAVESADPVAQGQEAWDKIVEQVVDHRFHQILGHADREDERPVPELSRRRPAHALAGLGA